MNRIRQAFSKDESGAVAVYVALALLVLLGVAALALDVAHMASVKRELTKAAEAGALSGARALWPQVLPADVTVTVTPDCIQATNIGSITVTKNQVEGVNLTPGEATVETGRWNYAAKTFTPDNSADVNGVRVTARRDGVPTILAQVLGQGPKNMSAAAIAVMDYAISTGKVCLPICIDDKAAFDELGNVRKINVEVHMSPDVTDNAGWFTVPPDSASASELKNYVNYYATNNPTAELDAGTIINLQNGADASVLAAIQDAFNKCMVDGSWTVAIPTVDTIKFGQDEPIHRFVGLKITEVKTTTSDKKVYGHLVNMCEVRNGLPGGVKGGVLAPPKLVQ